MTAASYSQEVLLALLKEIREFERKPQRNETFLLIQSDFNEWLRVWKMTIPEGGRASKDLFVFQKETKGKFIDLVKNEIRDLKSVKVSFEMKIKFTKENFETGVTQEMEHYFKEKEPHVFNEHNKQQIKQEFDRFIERSKGQIEAWSERGSGWVFERITVAYVNVARYQPLRGGTYLPLPANLAKKKAIINVQNRDNECLKWALRAALFPPSDGKNMQRTSKYPVNDGINYEGSGIVGAKQQPRNKCVRLGRQSCFSRADLLENHNKYCDGVNGRPTRIEMPEKGKTTLSFQNHHKQMRAPYVIYADFEALVRKISGCELGPESKQKSYTEKTEQHEACNFAYTVVRSDGRNKRPVVYRGKNAVEVFLKQLLKEENLIRNSLAIPKPLVMEAEDWEKHKNATRCHICDKILIKDLFLDSLSVWDHDTGRYCGQSHKEPLMKQNFKDSVKDHCHITGKYRGAAHNACNLKMRIKPKTDQIPVVFHNLRGYDAHHLMQKMSKLSQATQKEVKCVANNMEEYITFSLGGLRFIDSLNFLQGSLDSLVSATPKESLKVTKSLSSQNFELLFKKGIYPYEYMDSWERFTETSLPEKEKFYSKLNDDHITDEEYDHAKRFYLKQGMKLKRLHRVLEFEQECWMESYIRMNTEFRKKAKNDFEKNFYKLMNNSVFGKTMENLRNRVDIKIVRSNETNKIRKLVASPLYSRHVLFSNDLVGIDMRKSKLFLNKPVYTGMTILDNSKNLMYDFFYNHLKKVYGPRCELLYTDTDSLLLGIETDDIYEDMEWNKTLYDTSDHPKEHPLRSYENKKVLGKMKDECAGTPIAECVCLRPKMYSIICGTQTVDQKNIKKAKGVKKSVVKKQIVHEEFKETLFSTKQLWHGMNILRSEGHEIYGMHLNKVSLSPFDSKRWIADDGIHTDAYGYKFCAAKLT
ncbi:hypothetical protein ACROYT_G003048 [Oculina patagonica]